MKIILKGNVFNPTGMATVNREIAKALLKLGHQVQTDDIWHDKYEFNKGLEVLNKPLNAKDANTIFSNYPHFWQNGIGKIVGHFVHEGTRLWPGWADQMNKVDKIWVPSTATKKLFRWNGVNTDIEVIPHGISEIYKPKEFEKGEEFIFLSVNSWGGEPNDRKGTDLLIKAFDEEFKDEKVKLLLKISTFWKNGINFHQKVYDLIGHENPNILINDAYVEESQLVEYYQRADVFVAPTRGEAFGLTIANAMACGLPVIVTKDVNSGHMDYCKGKGVLFVDAPTIKQGDPTFFVKGNMLAEPDLESLKKQMRWAYENRDKLKDLGKSNIEQVKDLKWENTAKSIIKLYG